MAPWDSHVFPVLPDMAFPVFWMDAHFLHNWIFQSGQGVKHCVFLKFIIIIFIFSNLYTQYKARTHNPKIKGQMFFQPRQPGPLPLLPPNFFLMLQMKNGKMQPQSPETYT